MGVLRLCRLFLQANTFKSVKLKMRVGECHYVRLTSWGETHLVELLICYDSLTFMLNPNRYDLTKSDDMLLLIYSPLWKKSGFAYSSSFQFRLCLLNNATIAIRTISKLVPVDHVDCYST